MTKWPEDLFARLAAAAPAGIDVRETTDAKGVSAAWVTLADAADLIAAAGVLATSAARFSCLSAYQPRPIEADDDDDDDDDDDEDGAAEADDAPPVFFGGLPLDGETVEVNDHFDFNGDTVTLVIHVPRGGRIASLASFWRAADWGERELMELYSLTVEGHPDPRRLFLDPSLEPAVLERLIPHSALVNAASSRGLWEAIAARKEQSA
jgi:hypothetical protein